MLDALHYSFSMCLKILGHIYSVHETTLTAAASAQWHTERKLFFLQHLAQPQIAHQAQQRIGMQAQQQCRGLIVAARFFPGLHNAVAFGLPHQRVKDASGGGRIGRFWSS